MDRLRIVPLVVSAKKKVGFLLSYVYWMVYERLFSWVDNPDTHRDLPVATDRVAGLGKYLFFRGMDSGVQRAVRQRSAGTRLLLARNLIHQSFRELKMVARRRTRNPSAVVVIDPAA